MKGKFSLAVVVCLFLVGFVNAQNNVRVNEMETQAVFLANQLNTNLIVENSAQSFLGQIWLEVLDADDKILAQSEKLLKQSNAGNTVCQFRLVLRKRKLPTICSGIGCVMRLDAKIRRL